MLHRSVNWLLLLTFFALPVFSGCKGTVSAEGGPTVEPPINQPPVVVPDDPNFAPRPTLVRRLTRDEYNYTVSDVLGIELSQADLDQLPVDRPLEGFVKIGSGQTASPEHVEAYSDLGYRIASDPQFLEFAESVADCSVAASACASALVRELSSVLFRRPATDSETLEFTALGELLLEEAPTFAELTESIGAALLQSPQFIYLLEVERIDGFIGLREVGGFEMASRLSYLLWASAPDASLLREAESGALDDPEGILVAVNRMLEDEEKLSRVLDRFMVDWAGTESLPNDDGLRPELQASSSAFFRENMLAGTPLFELFTKEQAYLTPSLAENYGVPSAGSGVQAYDLTDVPGRGGLLTQPGVIAGMTNADGGEIVARGLFLQRQLFCGDAPDPPASLQEAIDEFVAAQPEDASDRAIAETRLMRPACAACHIRFDPLAYGFERFDFRGTYRVEDEHGNALNTDGWIPSVHIEGDSNADYGDMEELGALVRNAPEAQTCFTQRQLEYALASRLTPAHQHSIEVIRDAFVASGGEFSDLLRTLTTHHLFRVMETQ